MPLKHNVKGRRELRAREPLLETSAGSQWRSPLETKHQPAQSKPIQTRRRCFGDPLAEWIEMPWLSLRVLEPLPRTTPALLLLASGFFYRSTRIVGCGCQQARDFQSSHASLWMYIGNQVLLIGALLLYLTSRPQQLAMNIILYVIDLVVTFHCLDFIQSCIVPLSNRHNETYHSR